MRRLILIAAIGAISGLAYLLGWSSVFPVKSIEIAEDDQTIVKELTDRLNQVPAPIIVGEPIARVDKREITSRLRTLIWVEDVQVRRSFLSGEVKISVDPRSAIAQLDSRWSANPSESGFLGSDLEFFFVPRSEVAKAVKSGDADWLLLPNLSLGSSDRALIEDVASLMAALRGTGAEINSVTALNRDSIKSLIRYNERDLDISWGSVKELELKFEVMTRLLELKANRNLKRIDLSSPLAPIVSNS